MIRIWTLSDLEGGRPVQAEDKQVHYLFHVMRMQVGTKVLLFNGRDGEWECDVIELSKKRGVFLPVTQTRVQQDEPGVTLAFSLIKKDNMDLILQKATELGAARLIPLDARRSVVHAFNKERAESILIEAAEQCERLTVPTVSEPMTVVAFLKARPADETVVYLTERGQTTGAVARKNQVCFAVGPEGGWSDEELTAFEKHRGSVGVNLGRLILRAETACLSILACARFEIFEGTQE